METKEKYTLLEEAKKILQSKRCVFSHLYACGENIVRAHTIPKSHGLRDLAENGHVYAHDMKPYFNQGGRKMRKMGVNEVSTFYFACDRHDNDLFKTIEDNSFEINEESARTFFLRSVAQEVYESSNQIEMMKLLNKDAVGLPTKQKESHHYFELITTGDLKIRFCCMQYETLLPFLATTAYSPFHTMNGEQIFNSFDLDTIAPFLVINVFNAEGKGHILFTWPDSCNIECTKFVRSIIEDTAVTNLILGFLFTASQNLVLKPSFYEAIPDHDRNTLMEAFYSNIDPSHPFVNYRPNIRFNLPEPHLIKGNFDQNI